MNPNHHQIAERTYSDNHEAVAKVLARRHRRHPHDPAVQDAIAGAIVRLVGHLQRGGTAPTNEIAWLTVVAGREYLRPNKNRIYGERFPLTEIDENTVPHDGPGPEDTLIDRAADAGIQRALDQALGRLSPRQRDAMTSRAEGLTYPAIAERHGISNSAAEKAVRRARRNLHQDGRLAREIDAWRS